MGSSMQARRQGQISIYILLGILLLGLTITFFVIGRVGNGPVDVRQPLTNAIPSELQPLKQYVEQCVYDVTVVGLQKAGIQGGYISPVSYGVQDDELDATEGSGLRFAQSADVVLPYWYYLASENDCHEDCVFLSKRPPLEGPDSISVQSQVEFYVQEELQRCLNNFAPLRQQGMEVEVLGLPHPDISFNDKDVTVLLNYNVEVTTNDEVFSLTEYETIVPVPFRSMYAYATLITAASEQFRFLENHALELMSLYSGADREKLPPFIDTQFDFAPTLFWFKSDVKQQISDILVSYVPGLQVRNAGNYRPVVYDRNTPSREAIQRIYDNMVLPIEQPGFEAFDVNFEYLEWPYYFNINSRGEVIRPDSVSVDYLPFFGIQDYRNLYDVSYPVRIVIDDDNALYGEGFSFSFALEGNIRNNKPMLESFDQSLFENSFADEPNPFCQPQHLNAGPINFTVIDGISSNDVDNVQVMFQCGDLSCALPYDDAMMMPVCSGAFVSLLKQDYATHTFPLVSLLDESQDLGEFVLEPYRERKIIIKKKPLLKSANQWNFAFDQTRDIAPLETAIVSFDRVDIQNTLEEIQAVGAVSADTINENVVVRLIPGVYELRVDMLNERGFTIQPDRREEDFLFDDYVYYVPEQAERVDSFVSGGVLHDATNGFIEITKADLDSGDTMELYVMSFEFIAAQDSLVIEDLEIMSRIGEYTTEHKDRFGIRYTETNWEE